MYEFTHLKLTQNEFNNLLFMNPPTHEDDRFKDDFLKSLCTMPLKKVVKKVIQESSYKGQDPTLIFEGIKRESQPGKGPWFKRHTLLSKHFHKELMDTLWIRNLSQWTDNSNNLVGERPEHPECSFYITDGNHRALVYAVYLECGHRYKPVSAIHATSWDIASGILGWQPQPAHALEHYGRLKGRNQSYKGRHAMHVQLFESHD